MAAAIADPIRREILTMLRGTRLTAGAIAAQFPISRPAISRHLRVLRDSGLVHDDLVGRQRYYSLDAAPLRELRSWIDTLDRPTGWEHRLDALTTEVYRTRREHRAEQEMSGRQTSEPDTPENKENSA